MDRGNRNFGGSGRTYDMDYNAGYRGLDRDDRFGGGYSASDRDTRFRGGYGYGQERSGRGERDFGDRATFRTPGGRYDREFRGGDRDLGDRLRSGWDDLKEGARDMMGSGRGYDRGYRR